MDPGLYRCGGDRSGLRSGDCVVVTSRTLRHFEIDKFRRLSMRSGKAATARNRPEVVSAAVAVAMIPIAMVVYTRPVTLQPAVLPTAVAAAQSDEDGGASVPESAFAVISAAWGDRRRSPGHEMARSSPRRMDEVVMSGATAEALKPCDYDVPTVDPQYRYSRSGLPATTGSSPSWATRR